MVPLAAYAAGLRERRGPTPDADPLDGGADARVLLLLETPGPRVGPTGFVSRDNLSQTAANLRRFLAEAGLPRQALVIWNAVPWVIHATGAANRPPRASEVRDGLAELPGWLERLPNLRAAVLAGHVARRARPVLEAHRPEVAVFDAPHPSPTILCTDPRLPIRLVDALTAARESAASPRLDASPACGRGAPSPKQTS